jgi:hypothetical protein
MDQTHAEHHHQYAHVTNKLTLQLTHARTAQPVLSAQTPDKLHADHSHNNVTQVEEFN